ncbi:hypothetical protein [Arcobacter sp.]|uniref:hypothetical protein n=1 Tax=Arcobacter sp. TaxID=1872629 RepID=UPI003D11C160
MKNNPAKRLLIILEEGKRIPTNMNCKEVWCKLLEVEDRNNLSLILSRLGKLMELPDIIIKDIIKHYPEQKSYKHWSTRVNNSFSKQNLNSSWLTFIEGIDEHAIEYLRMSSALLDNNSDEELLTSEQLLNIKKNIDGIINDILDSDISENLKKYIIKYLRKILIAIEEYKISGIEPIIESLETTLGHAFLDDEYKSVILKESSIGEKIRNTLADIANLVTTCQGVFSIAQLTNLIPLK